MFSVFMILIRKEDGMNIGGVSGFYHAGISVKNLKKSIEFYCDLLNFELLTHRTVDDEFIFHLVNVPKLINVKIAFLKIPNTNVVLELLEYNSVERKEAYYELCDYGTGHICLYVSNIKEMYNSLKAKGYQFRSNGPVLVTSGINKGAKAIYMKDPDGYMIELFEKPNT